MGESCRSVAVRQSFLPAALYLEDSEALVAGLRIYGSPYTPKFCGAWQLATEAAAEQKWTAVPSGLDILITHGPPQGVLDDVGRGCHVGCAALRRCVRDAKPRFHLFGHIHEEGGQRVEEDGTVFLNAAQHVMQFHVDPQEHVWQPQEATETVQTDDQRTRLKLAQPQSAIVDHGRIRT